MNHSPFLSIWSLSAIVICTVVFVFGANRSVAQDVIPDTLLLRLESSDIEQAQLILDAFDFDELSLLEQPLRLPEIAEGVAPGRPMPRFPGAPLTSRLRMRTEKPLDADYPYHLTRFDLVSSGRHLGGLVQRDPGEQNGADLWRAYAASSWVGGWILAGDFLVDQGLGWTISSAPAWPSGYDAAGPSRLRRAGVKPNRSTEEGRGWRGMGGGLRSDALEVDLWGGYADYDARLEDDGWHPYSSQGDHQPGRLDLIENIGERHYGARIGAWLPYGVRSGIVRWQSSWDHRLAESGQASRFRGGGEDAGATGLDFQVPIGRRAELRTEVTRQDHNSWGGASVIRLRPGKILISTVVYRATSGFHTLHSRPFLPFGDDPGGRSGLQAGCETALERWRLGGWLAWERREPVESSPYSQHGTGGKLYGWGPIGQGFSLDLRYSLRWTERENGESEYLRQSARVHIFHNLKGRRAGLRVQGTTTNSGDGALISGYLRLRQWKPLRLAGSLTYLVTDGTGATLTVIEPSGPGLFPAVNLGRDQIRAATMLTLGLAEGLRLWISVDAAHPVGDESPEPTAIEGTETKMRMGIEWRSNVKR